MTKLCEEMQQMWSFIVCLQSTQEGNDNRLRKMANIKYHAIINKSMISLNFTTFLSCPFNIIYSHPMNKM